MSSKPSFFTLFFACCVLITSGCTSKSSDTKASSRDRGHETDASSSQNAQAATSRTLTVYSGRSEKLIAPVLAAFKTAHPNITLEINYAGTPELGATLLEEGANSPADVFLAQDASTLGMLSSQQRFAALPEALTAQVPENFRGTDGLWVAVSGRARVLAYNTDHVSTETLPANVDALTEPPWEGRVGWAPENASFQSFVAAMIQTRGREKTATWLRAMKDNKPRAYPSNTPAVTAVGAGVIDVALTNHYYLYRLRAEHGADFHVENHYFRNNDAASMINVSGAAILKHTSQRTEAITFITFLLSHEGQTLFVKENHELPVVAKISSPDELPAIDTLNAPNIDLAKLADLKEAVALLREVGVL